MSLTDLDYSTLLKYLSNWPPKLKYIILGSEYTRKQPLRDYTNVLDSFVELGISYLAYFIGRKVYTLWYITLTF